MTSRDRQILKLALPSIVANITVPLLGLVDVAIMGHIGDAAYIGAIAVGSMIFNVIYWLFGFLRMGTSGLTSQALGRRDPHAVMTTLARSVCVAMTIAAIILLLQTPIKYVAFWLVSPEPQIRELANAYFNICVWGAPAMLILYSLSGWFVGMQNTRLPMFISIFQNVFNIVVSMFLVFGLNWQVRGVAAGTLLAQYGGMTVASVLCLRYYGKWKKFFDWGKILDSEELLRFFRINRDIFLRTVCLVSVNFFFLSAGSRQGSTILAVNTLLTQLFILFSYVMDGFAFAGEALCGKYYGANDRRALYDTVRRVFGWGMIVSVSFFLLYFIGGQQFLSILTDKTDVVEAAMEYFPWALAVPFAGVAAFVWDGVFIGLTASRGMLVASAGAMACFFLVFFSTTSVWHNHALWLAFIVFMLTRGIVQTIWWKKYHKA